LCACTGASKTFGRNPNVRPRIRKRGRIFALVFDCETTTDSREDLTFLWWRFCELKGGAYVCQREGVVYRDNLNVKSIALIHEFVRGKRADADSFFFLMRRP
jgi:hypothetical protein